MVYKRVFLVLLSFHIASAVASVGWSQGCTAAQSTQIENAIDEAISIADNAVNVLNGFNSETKTPLQVDAAIAPLMLPGDIPTILNLYKSIRAIRTTFPVEVTFFCSENHIRFSASSNSWVDTAYSYRNPDGESQPAHLILSGFPDANTPPSTRGSYTTIGRTLPGGIDFSDQGHIYIHSPRFNPTSRFDTRPFGTILNTGLMPQFSYLDGMKPLSETVFHELLHIVGGTTSPGNGKLVITDGPNKNTYGYEACVKLNFDAPTLTLVDPTTVADCVWIVAKALYLQIANPHNLLTYWSTGAVDPTLLYPVHLPPQ